jgi:hypothetical protein
MRPPWSVATRRPLFLLVLMLIASGCLGGWGSGDDSGGCGDDDAEEGPCDHPYTGASLDGDWQLHATGKRYACDDRRLEGQLAIDTSVPLVIEASAQPTFRDAGGPMTDNESDAFIQRIERADFELSGDELPRKVGFAGQVRGSCVSFTLSEQLPTGDMLHYELDGEIEGAGEIHGTFTGTGPEQCVSSGSFTATVR